MNAHDVWRWLVGIDIIPEDATGLDFAWQHPLAPWMWLLVVAAAVLIAVYSYQGLVGSRRLRGTLGAVRGALIVLLVVLLSGPLLRLPIVEHRPDWVVVLVDRSKSLSVRDAVAADGQRGTREEQLRAVLADPVWAEVTDGRIVSWIGFDGSLRDITQAAPGTADGWDTDIGLPIEAALGRLSGRPASGIILISDGRLTRPLDGGVLRQLQARAIPVFPVPLGSADALVDLAVAEASAPQSAFIRDQLPVSVVVRASGGAVDAPIRVELVDESSGSVVDSVDLAAADFTHDRSDVTMMATASSAGTTRWRVRVAGRGEDLVTSNNEATVQVEFVDRPLRVLYIEGYPRWEYRYLKNLLVREGSIESSVMLLSADRDFAQEGNAPVERLPRTREEFSQYDLFVLGDVPSGSLSETQADEIRTAVGDRGAGLLWIGGERSTPASWRGTPLEDLLPMRSNPERHDERVTMEATPSAGRAGVLRLGEDIRSPWPTALGPGGVRGHLEWVQRIEQDELKPTADVLGVVRGGSGESWPAVIGMRYGAGRVVYVATDETWRWRHGVGESYQERFWIQLIRMLSRGSAPGAGESFRLEIDPRTPQTGIAATIRLEAVDPVAAERAGEAPLEAQVESQDAAGGARRVAVPLVRDGSQWVGVWTPDAAGRTEIHVESARIGAHHAAVEVTRRDIELGQPQADHALLKDIASRTAGSVILPGDVSRLKQVLPRRSEVSERSIVDPLWNSPLALIMLLALVFGELLGRRWLRLA